MTCDIYEMTTRQVTNQDLRRQFTPEEKENLEMIRDHIQAASLRQEQPSPKDDALSLDQYVCDLGAGAKTRQMVNLWARVMHGLESTQESAAWFIDYCRRNRGLLAIRADDHTGGNHMRLTTGMSHSTHNSAWLPHSLWPLLFFGVCPLPPSPPASPSMIRFFVGVQWLTIGISTETGAQQIPNGLADLLGRDKIHLSSPVMSITDHSSYVTVTTANNKTLQARKCIVSIPSTMYHELGVSPPLPDDVQEVTSSARLGHYNKAIVCYAKPWWRDLGYNGFVMSYRGPVIVGRDTSVDEKQFFALTCFVNGDEGIKWSRLDKEGRRAAVIRHLAELYGAQADSHDVHHPIEFLDQIWMHEPYSQGALAPVTALGHYTRFSSVYGQPVGNLHFVGTEYSPEWKGYMEGALCSGEKGADQVRETLAMEDAQRKRD